MSDLDRDSGSRRPLRIVWLVLGGIALTGLFVVLGFPYDRLADRLIRQFERDSGVRIDVADVSPGWVRWGIGLEARDIRVQQPDGTRMEFARLGARPALSLSWLSGTPALATELDAPIAKLSGVVTLGEEQGFDGRLRDVSLEQLPLEDLGAYHLEGTADAEVDLRLTRDGPEGTVQFRAREGSFSHPSLPVGLVFEKLRGDILLGGEQWAQVREFELESPLASGSARGTIGKAQSLASAPLRLDVDMVAGDLIQAALRAQGVRADREGRMRFVVTGTPARIQIR